MRSEFLACQPLRGGTALPQGADTKQSPHSQVLEMNTLTEPRARRVHRAFLPVRLARRLALAVGAGLFLATQVAAHSWYDPACCSGRDCAEIPVQKVHADPGGWRVTLMPGDHPMVDRPVEYFFKWGERRIRKSEDGAFHICLSKSLNHAYCLYQPEMGF
ncbi:hypothetical protein [Pseudooceanicola atlanticus]|uniref:hypothetical protein n=1 Tax=Pseudooceanicola atlanticus TaxID=1461694 RepID=UPI002354472B|nr:hypothetical protein [Pseudooceanicola atlanticus]